MSRRTFLALLVNALLFAALVLLAPRWPHLWAMQAVARLPWPSRVVLAILPLLVLIPPIAERLSQAIGWITTRLARMPRAMGGALLAGCGLLFWALRERTLWGDALYTIALLEGRWRTSWRGEYFWKEPLDRLTVVATYHVSHALIGWDAWHAIALVSCLAGVVYVWIAWRLASEIADDPQRRGLAFGLLLSPGAIQLLFGHVENYTLVTVTAMGYIWLAMRVLSRRSHPAWAASALGLAVAFHPQAIFLAPSLAVLAWANKDWKSRVQAALWLATGFIVPLLALMVLAQAVGAPALQIGVNRYADDTQLWLPLSKMLATSHLVDVLNNLYLVAPVSAGVILLLLTGRWPRERKGIFLAVATLGIVGYSLAFANKLPRPDDWDLFAITAAPVAAWAAYLVATAKPIDAQHVGVALITSSLCLTVPWVWENHAHQLVDLNPAKMDLLTIYQVSDLIAMFPQARVQHPERPLCQPKPGEDPTACQYVAITQFTMPQNGDARPVLVTHPPARAAYQITLPDEPTFLWLSLAMDPMTWGWGGDGATFVLT
ncbi:MAG: hypothetical protein J7M34_09810, partial [Anaerolineae bacterium]|nr:hypothetical protein [Anaerolineae bacterium]